MPVNHVAIILDGNRRFARSKGLPSYKGHEKGAERVEDLFDWAKELKIKELTLYSFSMQNFKRSKDEFKYLMKLFEVFFKRIVNKIKTGELKNTKINFIGRLNLFSVNVRKMMKQLMKRTKKESELKVNFAFGYGGREEIVDAVKKILRSGVKKVDEKTISNNLYMSSEPELIIRTGGDQRTSNFLPWQSTYSEWFFLKKLWPEFTKNDLKRVIQQYELRERRFGA